MTPLYRSLHYSTNRIAVVSKKARLAQEKAFSLAENNEIPDLAAISGTFGEIGRRIVLVTLARAQHRVARECRELFTRERRNHREFDEYNAAQDSLRCQILFSRRLKPDGATQTLDSLQTDSIEDQIVP